MKTGEKTEAGKPTSITLSRRKFVRKQQKLQTTSEKEAKKKNVIQAREKGAPRPSGEWSGEPAQGPDSGQAGGWPRTVLKLSSPERLYRTSVLDGRTALNRPGNWPSWSQKEGKKTAGSYRAPSITGGGSNLLGGLLGQTQGLPRQGKNVPNGQGSCELGKNNGSRLANAGGSWPSDEGGTRGGSAGAAKGSYGDRRL